MTYKLEKISAIDKEKILIDANLDLEKKSILLFQNCEHLNNESIFWAIDRERNCYMFVAPTIVRPESSESALYLFFKNCWYEIFIKSPFEEEVRFTSTSVIPSGKLLEELQEEIRLAFSVFGRWGKGPQDVDGDSDCAFVPKFLKGA